MEKVVNASSNEIDEARIERLIDFEIGRIDARQKNRGWTPWGLYAALCGLVWLMLDEVKKDELDFSVGWVLWSLLIFSNFTFKFLRGVLGDKTDPVGSSSRFSFSNQEIGSQRMLLAVTGSSWAASYIVLRGESYNLSAMEELAFSAMGCVLAVFFIVTLIASYFGLPMPKGVESRATGGFVFAAFVAVLLSYVTISLWVVSFEVHGWFSLSAWKMALAAFAICEVLGFLMAYRSDEPFLNVLNSMKRDLLLGHLRPEGAKMQLEITLKGMRAGQIMQNPVKNYLSLMESIEQRLRQASDQLDKINNILEQRPNSLMPEDEEMIRTRIQVIRTALDESSKVTAAIEKLRAQIRLKSRLLAKISPSCSKDIEEVWTEMSNSVDAVKKLAADSHELYKRTRELLGKSNKPELLKNWD